jgi:hypothetical protein
MQVRVERVQGTLVEVSIGPGADLHTPGDGGSEEGGEEEAGARGVGRHDATATATATAKRDNKRGGGGRPAHVAPVLLLNTLKTGMRLQGRVVSCTHYAAFVNLDVYRTGKGDR